MKSNEGFTLPEVLAVMIIVGILSAIAIPTYLNQTAKAKQAEAKSTVSNYITAQTAYRTEKSTFATKPEDLAVALKLDSNYYQYSTSGTDTLAVITAQPKDKALKGYSAAATIIQNSNNEQAIVSLICETKQPSEVLPVAPAAISNNPLNPFVCDSSQLPL